MTGNTAHTPGSQSLKDQGKSRTTTANILQSLDASQSLKDQGKSRTQVKLQKKIDKLKSQSLKDQGKSRTYTVTFKADLSVAIP